MTTTPKSDTPTAVIVSQRQRLLVGPVRERRDHPRPCVYLLSGVAFAGLTALSPIFRITIGVGTLCFLAKEAVYGIQCFHNPEASLEQRIAFAKGTWWQNVLIHSGCLLWGWSNAPAYAAFDAFKALANQLFPDATLLIDLFVGSVLLMIVGAVMISMVRALLAYQQDSPYQHLILPALWALIAYGVIETVSRALL